MSEEKKPVLKAWRYDKDDKEVLISRSEIKKYEKNGYRDSPTHPDLEKARKADEKARAKEADEKK